MKSEYAGKTVRIKDGVKHFQFPDFAGSEYRVEDYWENVGGVSWRSGVSQGNPACIVYSLRVRENNLPTDDEVLYGKVGSFGHLVHVSEIE